MTDKYDVQLERENAKSIKAQARLEKQQFNMAKYWEKKREADKIKLVKKIESIKVPAPKFAKFRDMSKVFGQGQPREEKKPLNFRWY